MHKNEPTSPIEGEDVPFTLGSTLGRVGLGAAAGQATTLPPW